ncbi:MAG: ATP-binding protein [Chloroflexota bacterium]
MSGFRFQYIEEWKEADLLLIPEAETNLYEYKSSLTHDDALGNKISVAASALWNSGGGIFIAGVNNQGEIDGGITSKVGKQSREDWADRQIRKTEPPGKYWINPITPDSDNSPIKSDHIVLVIGFEESNVAPHMAYDNRYYLRLGAHSESATHFLVEAIRAKRAIQTPILRAILRHSEHKSHIIELAIIVLNDAAALGVEITFDPIQSYLIYILAIDFL